MRSGRLGKKCGKMRKNAEKCGKKCGKMRSFYKGNPGLRKNFPAPPGRFPQVPYPKIGCFVPIWAFLGRNFYSCIQNPFLSILSILINKNFTSGKFFSKIFWSFVLQNLRVIPCEKNFSPAISEKKCGKCGKNAEKCGKMRKNAIMRKNAEKCGKMRIAFPPPV